MKDSTRRPDGHPQLAVGAPEAGRKPSMFDPNAYMPRINREMAYLKSGIGRSLSSRQLFKTDSTNDLEVVAK
jgi:hypothetical protein